MNKPYMSQKDAVRLNLIEALKFHNGNRTHTARGLGIGIRTLQRHLKDVGLSDFISLKGNQTDEPSSNVVKLKIVE